jgi:hypothetical protein
MKIRSGALKLLHVAATSKTRDGVNGKIFVIFYYELAEGGYADVHVLSFALHVAQILP